MRYFPVLQELFESDTVFFLIAGMIISVIACLRFKNLKKCIKGILVSAVIYGSCEIVSNIHTGFLLEIILLFIGTFAAGCAIGFLICTMTGLLKRSKEMEG